MSDNNTIKKRLKEFVGYQRISIREFERRCGLGNSFVNNIGNTIGADKLENIIQQFPELNRMWLLKGEGNMLVEENSTPVPIKPEEGIPYYENENFECGTPAGFGGALEVTNPDGYFQFPWVKNDGTTFCVRAHGNSMINYKDPVHSINHGSMVALRRSNVGTIQWGEVYALATADGYIIKKVMPSEKDNCVRCVSFNEESYPAFDLPAQEIYDYALVVGVANINIW